MDFTMDIAAMAMDMKAAQFQQNYAVALQSKAMDAMELAGQEIMELLPEQPAVQMPKGEFIDLYA